VDESEALGLVVYLLTDRTVEVLQVEESGTHVADGVPVLDGGVFHIGFKLLK
jgi:hypothetical protein